VGRIGERLRNAASKISVTLDCWTSSNNKAFLGITGHSIDDDWALQSLVLDFIPLDGDHTGENLCEAFVGACERLGILDKLLAVTTDNASNISKLLDYLEEACIKRGITFKKEQQHMRCMAHVVNLAVQAFLRELKADVPNTAPNLDCGVATQKGNAIVRLRRLLTWIRSSPQRSGVFKNLCDSCHVPRKEVMLDSCTRWNSTYAMIQRACELREPLSQVGKTVDEHLELSDEEWVLLKVANQILSGFDKATRWLSGSTYPTLNSAVRVYNHLLDELEYFLGRGNDDEEGRQRSAIVDQCSPANKRVLTTAMQAAHDKLCKYYSGTWASMYAIAVILDPRIKMDYYEADDWEARHVAHSKDSLVQAIEAYGGTAEAAVVAAPQPRQASSAKNLSDEMDEALARKMKRRRAEKKGELDKYLTDPTIDIHTDILGWWKYHAAEYPCLARIARDYLAIPATSAPAERLFSAAADLITKKRGSLSDDTIQACRCMHSWY
jgi:hypothetical protein